MAGEKRLVFRRHTIERMFERGVGVPDVRAVIRNGDEIEVYAEDNPYPSRLMLGWFGGRPLHVVAADETGNYRTFVITVYEPTPDLWKPGFREEEDVRCSICHQGETRQGTATVTLERDEMVLVFRKVPAEACEVCGEEYVDEETTTRLLQTAEDAFQVGVKVDVREYVAA